MKPLPIPGRVVLVALGPLPRGLLADAGAALTHVFGPAAALSASQDRPAYAFNAERKQFHASAILRRLAQLGRQGGAAPVVALTAADLFVPDAPFVFTEADRDAQSAVVSIARLARAPDGAAAAEDRLRWRARVEAVHALGLLLGLAHCADASCAMFLTHRAADSDRKGPGICGGCRAALGLAAP